MTRAPQRGISLAEALAVMSLIGLTAVALAPFETMLIRQLRDGDVATRPASLSWTARRLAADARVAIDSRVVSPSSVRFTMPSGRRVVWEGTAAGVRRLDGTQQRLDAGATLRVETRGALLDATLTDRDRRDHRVEVFLRHRGRP